MTVLILAGGYDQIALIQEFNKRGFETVLVDYYEAPPAKSYAAKHYQVSTLETDAVREIANEENVDLIITACTDQALVTMAKVSEELKLPCYLSYQTALEVTNKLFMKEKMLENKIPTSNFQVINRVDEVNLHKLQMPLVVKPVDANSSKGVIKINSENELEKAIFESLKYTRTGNIIVEEFITGDELSVDVWVEHGRCKIIGITSSLKIKENKEYFTIVQSSYPYALSENELEELESIIQKIIDCFKLVNSPLLVQVIKSTDGINVIEFSARMGGGSKYKLIEYISDIDIIKTFVDLSLGQKPRIKVNKSQKYFHMNYNYCNQGEINAFEGFLELKEEGIIDEYFFYKVPGMKIQKMENSSDRSSGYLVSGRTKDELQKKEEQAENMIKIISNEGLDIRRRLLNDK